LKAKEYVSKEYVSKETELKLYKTRGNLWDEALVINVVRRGSLKAISPGRLRKAQLKRISIWITFTPF